MITNQCFRFGALLLACSLLVSCSSQSQEPVAFDFPDSEHGFPVVETFDDFKKVLSPTDDRLYVINFWATWCKPCIEELPYFEQVNAEYANTEVEVILVSLDAEKEIAKRLVPFLEKNELQSDVLALIDPDFNSWIDQVSEEWSGAIPATIFVKGDQQQFYEQSFELEEL
ncbi:MAG: TlpA disulfide reductase family protein, partial [Bacteroidota bacterium]